MAVDPILLYDQPLFSTLTVGELEEISDSFEQERYDDDDAVFRLGDEAESFYLIVSGEFAVWIRNEAGEEERVNLLYPGEFFGELALYEEGEEEEEEKQRSATVRAIEDSVVLAISGEDLSDLRKDFPEVDRRLRKMSNEILRRSALDFPGKAKNEVVLYHRRRHLMALVRRLARMPLLLTLLWFVVMGLFYFLLRNNVAAQWTVVKIGSPFLIAPLLIAIWQYLDWRNDFFIVTSERVIHIEKVIFLFEERFEAPLNKIQNVNVTTTPISQLFEYGDAFITTAAQGGGVTFTLDYMPDVAAISDRIIKEMNKERELLRQQGKRQKRQSLREALKLEEDGEPLPGGEEDREPVPSDVEQEQEESALGSLFGYFIPRTREQEGDQITWRKHWIILLMESGPAWITFFLILGLGIAEVLVLGVTGLGPQIILGIVIALLIGNIGWLWWRYEDWRNDLYILTPEIIIDQEQKPFGFDKEVRRASLDMVQDTRYAQPNPLMVLLNVGNVRIQTAGQEGLFTFDWVKDPRGVQHEIYQYIKTRQAQREREEAAALSQGLMELLKMYDEETRQKQEDSADADSSAASASPASPAPSASPAPDTDESDPDATTRQWPYS